MTPERWRQIKEIFHSAVELEPEARASFLDDACAGRDSLRREVEALLTSHERAGSFIKSPAIAEGAGSLANNQAESLTGQSIGHYNIIGLLGVGGMGRVYLAQDTRLRRKVALKVLSENIADESDRMRRFEQEALAASALNHPNILTVYELGETEGSPFIVSEFVCGETLRERAKREPLTRDESLEITIQIAAALEAAHKAGIIHRDIKPENVMLREDGVVKVLDFGLAKLTETHSEDLDTEAQTLALVQTAPGIIMGTVSYMSPEQARGVETDARTDIWSLGVVLYEMLTGRLPFEGETMTDRVASILRSEVPPLSDFNRDLPPELEQIVSKALRKELAERYESATALLTDLRQLKKRLEFAAELERSAGSVRHAEAETQIIATASREMPPARITAGKSVIVRHTVGRARERAELRASLEETAGGRGLLFCVAGEPGLGKTTLVEDFLSELVASGRYTIARGRCSERLAGTEAYLPLLEALESLLRNEDSPEAARLMRQVAPTWYAQLVPLSNEDEETARLIDEVRAASQERMKRELVTFLQEVSRIKPLVLFFDDLHWADVSTVDLLSFLASKFDALGLLAIVTYRPSDLLLAKHPFLQIKPDLQARGLCRELTLGFLSREEIADYISLEFPGHHFPQEFPKLIHAKTEGSPLFMADLMRYLRDRGVIARDALGAWTLAQALPEIERDLPESVRGMIERKIAQLGEEERRLLVAASVQGYEFDSAVVARVLKLEPDEVEERLEKLERVHAFVKLVDEREYPDRTLTLRYRFVHVLYQNALYASLRVTRKVSLSREVAEALEGFYGERRADVASELAALWEAAREYARAADYFQLAASQAGRIMAAQEAAALAQRGLKMVLMLPESLERAAKELALQVVLGNALFATRGYAAPEVEETCSRAYELGRQIGEPQYQLPLLWGLYAVSFCRPQYPKALAYGEEFLRLAEQERQEDIFVIGYAMIGTSLFWMGELYRARDYLQRSVSLYTPEQHRPLTWVYGHEPGMYAEIYLSWTYWLLGYPDQAIAHTQEFLRLGLEVSHAQSQAFACVCGAFIYQCCGDRKRVGELAEEGFAISSEQGLPLWLAYATTKRGWLRAGQGEAAEGIAEMRRGIAALRSTGAEIALTMDLCGLAEVYGKTGQPHEGLAVLADALALAERSEERCWEAELYRVRGELLLGAGRDLSEGEASFHKALEIAKRQGAKSLELRAEMSLARLLANQGRQDEALERLTEIYGWFTEGFDTQDLKDAGALIKELS